MTDVFKELFLLQPPCQARVTTIIKGVCPLGVLPPVVHPTSPPALVLGEPLQKKHILVQTSQACSWLELIPDSNACVLLER